MTTTTFAAGTVIASTWLQDVNDHVYDTYFSNTLSGTSTTNTSGVATTLLTLPNSVSRNYMVSAYCTIAGSPEKYNAYAIVAINNSEAAIMSQVDGILFSITLSGMAVQCTQTSGSNNVTITCRATPI